MLTMRNKLFQNNAKKKNSPSNKVNKILVGLLANTFVVFNVRQLNIPVTTRH